MTDLTTLSPAELMKFPSSGDGVWAEIKRRLERLEKCEAALRTIARGIGMDHLKPKDVPGVMQDVARSALEDSSQSSHLEPET